MKRAKYTAIALAALLVVLTALKVTHVAEISWLAVLLPALIPVAAGCFCAIALFITMLLADDPEDDDYYY